MDAHQIYRDIVLPLSAADRMTLASMILNETEPAGLSRLNLWSDQEIRDCTADMEHVRGSPAHEDDDEV